MSTRQSTVDALETRLKEITTANGYQTDAGNAVYMWRKTSVKKYQMPGLVVVDRLVERNLGQAAISRVENQLTVEIVAIAIDMDEARQVEEDVVKCLGDWDAREEVFDWLYVSKTELLKEDRDAEYASVQITVIIEYDTDFNQI